MLQVRLLGRKRLYYGGPDHSFDTIVPVNISGPTTIRDIDRAIAQACRQAFYDQSMGGDPMHRWSLGVYSINGWFMGYLGHSHLNVYGLDMQPDNGRIGRCRAFEGWLEGKPATEIVGLAREGDKCPVKHYLQDKWGGMVDVNGVLVRYRDITGDMGAVSAPQWVRDFITKVDRYGRPGREQISAGVALEIAHEVCSEE